MRHEWPGYVLAAIRSGLMAAEEAFKVEIPDSARGDNGWRIRRIGRIGLVAVRVA
jgi:hypothetical protein